MTDRKRRRKLLKKTYEKKEAKFHHLSLNDRFVIERMLLNGAHKRDIAQAVGCSLRTIYYEIKRATYMHRNSDWTEEERYAPETADERYQRNLDKKGRKPLLLQDERLRKTIEKYIKVYHYSPDAALTRIKESGVKYKVEIKSVTTIYEGIRLGYFDGIVMEDLPRRGEKKQRKQRVTVQKTAAPGTSIEKRDPVIGKREEFGHWEMDTVHGRSTNDKALLVLTEMKTRMEIIEPLKHCTTDEVRKALNRLEKKSGAAFYLLFKTITCDNGSEFKDPTSMEKALYRKGNRTKIFFCHPRSPHERGSNENANLLVRRWFPKGSDFDRTVKRSVADDAAYWINTYPRRLFKGLCALDLFEREMEKINVNVSFI